MDVQSLILLVLLFFGIAVLYASAGFGGGSSYLAILSFFPLHFHMMRSTALVCNLVVVSGSLWQFYRHEKLNKQVWQTAIYFIVLSIPASFFMTGLGIDRKMFLVLLGITLFFSANSLWVSTDSKKNSSVDTKPSSSLGKIITGGILGSVAGLVGIGGGIFLSPWMHLRRLAVPQVITIVSTIFIFVNSAAALTGQFVSNTMHIEPALLAALAAVVFLGGRIGVRFNLRKLDHKSIRKITAVVVFLASINVLLKGLSL